MQEMVELLKKVESVEDAAERLIEQAYDKGFDNGFEHGKESAKQFDADLKKSETDQQKRDRLVKKAKEFVEKFTNSNIFEFNTEKFPLGWWAREMDSTPATCKLDFIVNKEKRTVVCLIKNPSRDMRIRSKGIAKCAPNDCFNRHIGEFIALHRALGLDVPQEYLDVLNPTDVRVGNLVKYPNGREVYILKNSKFNKKIRDKDGMTTMSAITFDSVQILDDSESEPNV